MNKKRIIKYILLFLFFYVSLVFIFTLSRSDTFVNFGFSYAISKGQIPYRDFNMVITPFAPFLYSIGLLMCNNILVYYLEQALLLTLLFYYIDKILGKKSILFLLILIIPYPIAMSSILFPGYNYIVVLLLVMFIYYFKNNKNDYLLGLILGFIFCTKQTMGIVLFVPTFYFLIKDREKFKKMFIGYIIPIIILFIYLIITKSLYVFYDLCFLGLFDFNKSNNNIDIYYLLLFILGVVYLLFRIIKDKNNILLYYILLYSLVVFPIVDYYHTSIFLIIIFLIILDDYNLKRDIFKYIVIIIAAISVLWLFVTYYFLRPISIRNYNNFSLVINEKSYNDNSYKLIKYTSRLDKKVIFFMRGSENFFYKITCDKKLNYYDLPNYGNYGYNGIEKIKNRIKNEHDCYFVIDRVLVKNNSSEQQYIKELGQYVIKHSRLIKSIGLYDIYYKE